MPKRRQGELGYIPFRSCRIFNIDAKWYFACREGKDLGPFHSKEDAEVALKHYIYQFKPSQSSHYL